MRAIDRIFWNGVFRHLISRQDRAASDSNPLVVVDRDEHRIDDIMPARDYPIALVEHQPLTGQFSELCQKMNIRPSKQLLMKAGRDAAKRHRELHGDEPIKRRQWVDGVERDVNHYTSTDEPWLAEVVRATALECGMTLQS